MNKLVLDTNAYTAYLAGDKNILAALAKANTTFLSIFVLGELYAGFTGGTRKNQNIDLLQPGRVHSIALTKFVEGA